MFMVLSLFFFAVFYDFVILLFALILFLSLVYDYNIK